MFLGSECYVVMLIGMRMQIVVCISMIDFMAGNGEHETGIFATLTGKVVQHRVVCARLCVRVCAFMCVSI